MVFIIALLMCMSLFAISSYCESCDSLGDEVGFFSPLVHSQLKYYILGWAAFFFFACFDYNKLREYAWFLYGFAIVALIGVFFVDPIQRVHRWYRLPIVGFNFQPSEYAKIACIIALSWFLEKRAASGQKMSTAIGALIITAIPFVLILRQPDLGTSLILFPISYACAYFGNIHPFFLRFFGFLAMTVGLVVFCIFSGLIPYESAAGAASGFLKEYQYERLNPNTHHQKAAMTAIALGGISGAGWQNSSYSQGGFLPTPYTDSIFALFGEEFGFLGLIILLVSFYALIYCCFQVTCVAKDTFGRLLAAGISTYIAVHVVVNIAMMSGLIPIIGVPLILMSYGGSSLVTTMCALGILQSIYSRRFMF